jgi:predicted GH43/DUF377 family glycosyl hydrolase
MTDNISHPSKIMAQYQISAFVSIVVVFFLVSYSSLRQRSDITLSDPPGSHLEKLGIVVPVGSYGEWDSGMVESPVVWFDVKRKMYGMVYTGYASTDSTKRGYKYVARPQVGLAWSDDLHHWKKDPKNPIFAGSGVASSSDAEGTAGPFIWYENGTYFLFYIGLTAQGYEKGTKTMNIATSADLYTWKRYRGNPIIAPAGNSWRRDAIWHPNIVKSKDRYFLFFNASGVNHGLVEEFIGYAMSMDLFHWWVDDVNSPLVVGSAKPGSWDASGRAGDPSVYKDGAKWLMAWYSWDKKNSADGIAWTTEEQFPLGWNTYDHNPVLRIGGPGSYDALHAGKPYMFRAHDSLYHFYTAVALDEKRQIAVAACPDLRK